MWELPVFSYLKEKLGLAPTIIILVFLVFLIVAEFVKGSPVVSHSDPVPSSSSVSQETIPQVTPTLETVPHSVSVFYPKIVQNPPVDMPTDRNYNVDRTQNFSLFSKTLLEGLKEKDFTPELAANLNYKINEVLADHAPDLEELEEIILEFTSDEQDVRTIKSVVIESIGKIAELTKNDPRGPKPGP